MGSLPPPCWAYSELSLYHPQTLVPCIFCFHPQAPACRLFPTPGVTPASGGVGGADDPLKLPFKDNIHSIFCAWLTCPCFLPSRSLSCTLRSPQSGGDRAGHRHPHTGALEGTQRKRTGWRGLSGWASRPVGNSGVEEWFRTVGTDPHGKFSAGDKWERCAQGPHHTGTWAFRRRRISGTGP